MFILPKPKKFTLSESLNKLIPSIFINAKGYEKQVDFFINAVKKITGVKLYKNIGGISIIHDKSLDNGNYLLKSNGNGIDLYFSDCDALCYGFATLLQVLTVKNGQLYAPKLDVNDFPDCSYRGLMIDVARQWHAFENLLEYVDICFLYKIKYLHIHFIDDEGYRLPSKILPNLSSDKFYTFDQLEFLVEYASARNVQLVPEIETVGHCISFLEAYPEIFDLKPKGGVAFDDFYINGIKKRNNVVCTGSKTVRDYMKELILEIKSVFKYSSYIHLGGDEASINAWEKCSVCSEYIKNNSLKDVHELYGEYLGELASFVLENNLTPIIWEGFSKEVSHFIPKKTVIVAWESYYNIAPDLLADGFKIINCSWKPLYITPYMYWTMKEIGEWSIFSWRHWWEKSQAYGNGIDVLPTDQVLGGQLCAWENTYEQEYEKIRKNLLALSERTWNKNGKPYSFFGKTARLYSMIDKLKS